MLLTGCGNDFKGYWCNYKETATIVVLLDDNHTEAQVDAIQAKASEYEDVRFEAFKKRHASHSVKKASLDDYKGNAYLGIDAALALVRETGNQPVPLPIRNAPTQLMKELGYHDGYMYPHDYPGHFTPQQYMPDELQDKRLWHGQHNPQEEKLWQRMVNYWGKRFEE